MILLERAYMIIDRRTAADLLAATGVVARGLGLATMHRLLRENCPSAWCARIDTLLVVEDWDLAPLGQRFQQEVAAMDPPPSGRAGLPVMPRSVALWPNPELAALCNEEVAAVVAADGGDPVAVVDDAAVIDATIAFNRHVRDHVDHGHTDRGPLH